MNQDDKHIENELFSRVEIPYAKSREEAWEEISNVITEERETVPLFRNWRYLSVAASVTLLLAVFAYMRFQTKTFICPPGKHLSINLPDGSKVDLNASSELSFHPAWWRFEREVKFEGEAFFNVEPGEDFRVHSKTGSTEVLGTSFNIFSRSEMYRVTCMTGRVKVLSADTENEAILLPFEQATITADGNFEIILVKEGRSEPAWKNNFLVFTSMPLREVLNEIERQYNIELIAEGNLDYIYTGNFTVNADIEDILSLICMPFDLEFMQKSNAEYIIKSIPHN